MQMSIASKQGAGSQQRPTETRVHLRRPYKSGLQKHDRIQLFIGFDQPHRSNMNTCLVLAAISALLVHQASGHNCTSGSGNSCEAETRKKDCGGLVKEPESSEEQDVPPVTVDTPPPGDCIWPAPGSGSGDFHSKCELIKAFYNISINLSIDQRV